jgi:hypothetical protein
MLPKIRTKTPNLMQKNEVRRVVSPSLMPTEGKLSFELQRESWGQGSSPCRSRAGLSPWLRPPKGRESPHALGGRASYRVGRAGPPASPLRRGHLLPCGRPGLARPPVPSPRELLLPCGKAWTGLPVPFPRPRGSSQQRPLRGRAGFVAPPLLSTARPRSSSRPSSSRPNTDILLFVTYTSNFHSIPTP